MTNLLLMVSVRSPTPLERFLDSIPVLVWLGLIIGIPIAIFVARCLLFARAINQSPPPQRGFDIVTTRRQRS